MSIIDEMRKTAHHVPVTSPELIEKWINEWADRLAAENAELRKENADVKALEIAEWRMGKQLLDDLAATNATLDKLRAVVKTGYDNADIAWRVMPSSTHNRRHQMNSKCSDCGREECRCDQPPMPAASPWRYDVENAPKDVRLLTSLGGDIFEPAEYRKNKGGYLVWFVNDIEVPVPAAFATINPPENEA